MDKIRRLTRRRRHRTLADLLRSVNRVLRGWCNYYRHGVSKRTFGYLDHFVFCTVGRHCAIPMPGRSNPHTMGESDTRITTTSGMNTWRAGCAETCTSGSEGGPEKPTSRKADRVLRSDPYTEHRTREGKIYCAVVLDVFSRRAVGWSIDSSPTSSLVTSALGMAIDNRRPEGTVIHSDQGTQGEFNWSSQHRLVGWSVGAGRGLRPATVSTTPSSNRSGLACKSSC